MESLKILIPTDFSVQAEFAYLMVKKLEEKVAVEVHFLHVLNVPDTVTLSELGEIQTCGEIDKKYIITQQEIAERNLANLRSLYGSHVQTHLVFGKLTDAILSFSEANHYDLIVMGTKGAWGIKEKISGSETQFVARRSKIPLLSLMCDRSDLDIRNILLVHDFSNPVQEDLKFVHKLINIFDVKIHFLQVISGNSETEIAGVVSMMNRFAEMNNIVNFACHVISDKDVENGVIQFNQMAEMDIICIGTHGRGRVFHHNATEKLINHLFKPIISFRLNN